MILRSILIGGEPGGGKSNLLNLITAHAALHPSYRHPESG
jgi:S-DNA-T family DNA segregation ATPase FtsK/SpoIIIE